MLERIWQQNQGILRCIVRQILFDRSAVDDVLQEAFMRVLQSKKTFATENDAYQYLRRVVLNTAIDHYRRLVRRNSLARSQPKLVKHSPSPLALLIHEEQEHLQNRLFVEMGRSLERLPAEQKQAIDLMFSRNGKKLKEICQEKKIPYSTLRSRMMAAIDQIRRDLKAKGLEAQFDEVKQS